MSALASTLLALTLLATGHAPADSTAVRDITAMLNTFLAGAGRNDAAAHDRFWADDLVYTGSGGRRIGKAQLMTEVRAEPAPKPGDESFVYGAEDVRVQPYGDAALLAFRLVATRTHGDTVTTSRYLNSGMFVRRRGQWRVVGWQATRLP